MAYAVVVSLKQTLQPLLDSSRSRIQIPNLELKLIYDDLCYAKSFLDKINSLEDSNTVEEVEKEIKVVAQNTRDLIEFHLSDLVYSGSESSISVFSAELVGVKRKLGSLVKKLKAKEDELTGEQQSAAGFGRKIVGLRDDDVSANIGFGKNKLVGLDDELSGLCNRLCWGNAGRRRVSSIVGMAGIGFIKHRGVSCNFPVEIRLEYELKQVLLRLLGPLGLKGREEEVTVGELKLTLYHYLYGRRYLVVLDDICDTRVWTELQRFLPDNQNGSSIIVTSRNANIARSVSDKNCIVQMVLLNDEQSWDLLSKMAFSDMECPPELEEIGKRIAKSLGGLPLSIVMIGELLSKSKRRPKNWMAVAENIDSIVQQQTTIPTFMKVSYTELPQHLKACFLYLGLFPPNYNIPTAQLIKLWVAEGFIEPVAGKGMEQKAEEYLQDLVSRSLVIVHKMSSTGRIKSCRIHQLLKDLCVSEAREEKLFHIVKEGTTSAREATSNQRRLGIQNDVVIEVTEPVSGVRSLVFICPRYRHPLRPKLILQFRRLRVLHAPSIRFRKFPSKVVKLVRLRYLAITYDGKLPSSISRLRNLEVLIIHPTESQTISSHVFLPIEIWKLHKLRHLHCVGFDLPDPSIAAASGHRNDLHLVKLLTLSGVSARSCTEEVLARMPDLIKLGIRLEATENTIQMSCFDAVDKNLRLLRSFKCAVMNSGLPSEAASSLRGFPSRLRKLTLSGCGFLWDEHMPFIYSLPNLQVLKLRWHSFCGREWIPQEGGFMSLKYLLLEDLDIDGFMAKSEHFPVLEHLLIRRCYEMQEIPSGIGDFPTLRVIEVHDCSNSVIRSARDITEEQESRGNDDLQVRIYSSGDDGLVGEVYMTDSSDSDTSKCHCC